MWRGYSEIYRCTKAQGIQEAERLRSIGWFCEDQHASSHPNRVTREGRLVVQDKTNAPPAIEVGTDVKIRHVFNELIGKSKLWIKTTSSRWKWREQRHRCLGVERSIRPLHVWQPGSGIRRCKECNSKARWMQPKWSRLWTTHLIGPVPYFWDSFIFWSRIKSLYYLLHPKNETRQL